MANCFKTSSLVAFGLILSSAASAQHSLYDSSSYQLGVGDSKVEIVLIPFDGNESSLYSNLSWTYGLTDRVMLQIRGSVADKETIAAPGGSILTGGSDIEVRLMTRADILFLALGAAIPDTGAQDEAAGTFQVGVMSDFNEDDHIMLAVTGVTSDEVTLVGFGGGVKKTLSNGLGFDASATFILRGDNTISLGTSALEHEPLFAYGLSYQATEQVNLRLGYGNSIGVTTGFSLTPRLGGGGGLYLGAQVKF